MKQEEILQLLQNPAQVSFEQTSALGEVLQQYPYFQAARAVRLKGLKNNNSLHYNKELKKTAAYTTDRSVLFDFITSEEFNQNQIAEQIKRQEQHEKEEEKRKNAEKAGEDENVGLDKALKMKYRESEQVFDPELFRRTEKKEKISEEEELKIGSPLVFHKNENHSFSELSLIHISEPTRPY